MVGTQGRLVREEQATKVYHSQKGGRNMSIFKGAGVAIITPSHEDGNINYTEFDRLTKFQIQKGVNRCLQH